MKKLFIVSMVALLCLGLTLPAVAKVKVGGMITQDVFYFSQNDKRARSQAFYGNAGVPSFPVPAVNPQSTFSVVDFRLPQAFNRLNVAYSNDDNTIRGFIEVRGGSSFADAQNALGQGNPGNALVWNYAWIDWVLSPKDFLRFGRQTQRFAIRAPQQRIGINRRHVVGNNFGNLHGGSSRDGVVWYHRFNDTVQLELGLYDPDNDRAEPIAGFSPEVVGGATARILEENVLPRLDVALPLNFGMVRLWPSATYLEQKYDQVGPGRDDKVTCYGLALGGRVATGPLTFDAEIGFGKNLGNGNYVGAAPISGNGGAAGWNSNALVPGNDAINDSKVTAWWLDVGWKIGPATIHGIVGNARYKREDDPNAGGTNVDQKTWMYGISVPIAIAKGFTIRPELMGYDRDSGATVGNTTERNYGKEYIVGVQFQLIF